MNLLSEPLLNVSTFHYSANCQALSWSTGPVAGSYLATTSFNHSQVTLFISSLSVLQIGCFLIDAWFLLNLFWVLPATNVFALTYYPSVGCFSWKAIMLVFSFSASVIFFDVIMKVCHTKWKIQFILESIVSKRPCNNFLKSSNSFPMDMGTEKIKSQWKKIFHFLPWNFKVLNCKKSFAFARTELKVEKVKSHSRKKSMFNFFYCQI